MKRKGYKLEDAVRLILRHWLEKGSREENDRDEAYEKMLCETGLVYGEEDIKEALAILTTPDVKANERREKAYRKFLWYTRKERVRHLLQQGSVAAGIVLSIGIGVSLLFSEKEQQRMITEQKVLAVQSKAYLTLSNGNKVDLAMAKQYSQLERDYIAKCDSGMLVYEAKNRQEVDEEIYNQVHVPRGGDFKLMLSDGSRVWLNAESELKYPVVFNGKTREVHISGEAYFDVASRKDCPFIVHTSRGRIEVLGTEFNVRDYADEKRVETTLAEGSVAYHAVGKHCQPVTVWLNPGYQIVDSDDNFSKKKVDVAAVTGWKNGNYTFYDKSLEELMHYVERTYDVQVFFTTERVKNLRFSGDLQRYVCVELFLRYLEQGGDVRFTVRNRTIVVYEK